jgi:GT2 family glycosyltransferase
MPLQPFLNGTTGGCALKASIVIVNFNSGDHLKRCLQSIIKQTTSLNYDIWVVDNHSRDHSLSCLGNFSQYPIHLIKNESNLGYAKACNQGLRRSTGDLLVTMNPDVEVGPDWLNRLSFHLMEKKVLIVGPMSLGIGGKQWAGPLRFPQSLESANRCFYRQNRQQNLPAKYIIGCLMVIKRQTLSEIGYLDEELFLGADDFDLSLRVRMAGYELRIARDVLVRHVCHVSFRHPDEHTNPMAKLSWQNFNRKWETVLKEYGWENLFENERPIWYSPKQFAIKENRYENYPGKDASPRRSPRAHPKSPRTKDSLVPYTFSQRGGIRFSAQCDSTNFSDPMVGRLRRGPSAE